MKGFAEKKIPGGKLVSARVEYSETIRKVEILGDFFVHPEESLERIEKSLEGASADAEQEELTDRIKGVVSADKIEMIGVTPETIAEVIKIAISKASP